jgi:hypothetical protein
MPNGTLNSFALFGLSQKGQQDIMPDRMTIENADRLVEIGGGVDVGFDPYRQHPYRYHFGRVPWAVFGSVSFGASNRWHKTERSAQYRRLDFSGVLHLTCSYLGLRGKNIGIYHATEYGLADHCHLHFLVAQDGLKVSPKDFSETFEQYWTREFRPFDSHRNGVGTAVVKPYDQAYGDRGVAYCLKREFDGQGREQERYDFLSRKLFNILRRVNGAEVVNSGLATPHRSRYSGSVHAGATSGVPEGEYVLKQGRTAFAM